eukprot:scaffold1671_cov344-Pavlova_lutheri.AAC.30
MSDGEEGDQSHRRWCGDDEKIHARGREPRHETLLFQFSGVEEPSAGSAHPPCGMFVPGFVQVRFPGLDEFVLLLRFRPGLPPTKDTVVLLGIDVHGLFFHHLRG